jgi:hypothetical protein
MENKDQTQNRQWMVLLYFIAVAVAVLLRFFHLGNLPLGNLEAGNALQALNIAQGKSVIIGSQPGYVALTSLLFFVFSSSEFFARFWPALFGVGLVLTPLLYRKWLGDKATLILAFFFAIEPGFTALSRTATGSMIGLVSLCAAVGFLLNHKSALAGVFTGIAILGGSSIWPGLIGLLLTLAIFSFIGQKRPELEIDIEINKSNPVNWKAFLFSFGAAIVLLGTVFMIKPSTISGLGTSLAAYFGSWVTHGASIKVLLIGLLLEQMLAIPLALWGLFVGTKKQSGLTWFLGVWTFTSFVLVLANLSSQVVDWLWFLLPLWALAALGLTNILTHFSKNEFILKLFQAIVTISLIVFASLNLLSVAVGTANTKTEITSLLSILLPLALLVVVSLLINWGWSVEASRQGLIFGIGLLLVVITFGSAWKSAGLGSRPEMELWRSDPLPIGRDLLLKSVSDLSLWNSGQNNGLDIVLLKEERPALQWALRGFTGLENADILSNTQTPSLVISSVENEIDLSNIYRGQEITWSAVIDFEKFQAKDWLKWFALRNNSVTGDSFLLWARTDLFKGS